MTQDHAREVLSAATKVALAFRALRLVQKDLSRIMSFEGWDDHLKAFKEAGGEHPQLVRRVRVKQSKIAAREFWEAVKELEKVVG